MFDRGNGGANNKISWIDGLGLQQVKNTISVSGGPTTVAISGGSSLGCTDYGGANVCTQNSTAFSGALGNQCAFGIFQANNTAASVNCYGQTFITAIGFHSVTLLVSMPAATQMNCNDATGMIWEGVM